MDKNEILRRSQEENQYGDEREKQIEAKSESFGQNIIVFGLIILTVFNWIKGLPVKHFIAIFWASISGRDCLLFYRHRKVYHGVIALAAAILCVANIIEYLGGI